MAMTWDIFLAEQLEVRRGLGPEEVREELARGRITEDDLARPSGTSLPWTRVGDLPELLAPAPVPSPEKPEAAASAPETEAPPTVAEGWGSVFPAEGAPAVGEVPALPEVAAGLPEALASPFALEEDDEEVSLDSAEREGLGEVRVSAPEALAGEPGRSGVESLGFEGETIHRPGPEARSGRPDTATIHLAEPLPVAQGSLEVTSRLTGVELYGTASVDEEDEEAARFTLASQRDEPPEEIDLTAMVDVAFQLVLFFLVTATTIYFKTLEIPRPDPEDKEAVAQEMRTLEEMMEEYILVEIDPQGRVQVDREPIEASGLIDRLREARAKTLRTQMLLMADFSTPHANAVAALDAATEIGLSISLARPTAPLP